MLLDKMEAQQPWDFFSVPLDQEQPFFIIPSLQPSYLSYLWGTYFVANTWMIMNKYVQAKVRIMTDLMDNEFCFVI